MRIKKAESRKTLQKIQPLDSFHSDRIYLLLGGYR